MDPFLGQIVMFGGNFAPRNWAFCHGQLLPVAQNTALYSLLGTYYGGDGRTTFGLPDLRGRSPVGPGYGPGLNNVVVGQKGGVETQTLLASQMPAHNHTVSIIAEAGTPDLYKNPTNRMLGAAEIYATSDGSSATNVALSSDSVTVSTAGATQPFGIRNPYQAVHFIIALQGVFPSRN